MGMTLLSLRAGLREFAYSVYLAQCLTMVLVVISNRYLTMDRKSPHLNSRSLALGGTLFTVARTVQHGLTEV